MSWGLFYGENAAPGSGRFTELLWDLYASPNITEGTTVPTFAAVVKGGDRTSTGVIVINNGATTPRYRRVQGQMAVNLGDVLGVSQLVSSIYVPNYYDVSKINFLKGIEARRQIIWEAEIASGAIGNAGPPYYTWFGLSLGNGFGSITGTTNSAYAVVQDHASGAWQLAYVRNGAIPAVPLALISIGNPSPLVWNKFAFRWVEGVKNSPAQVDVFVNDVLMHSEQQTATGKIPIGTDNPTPIWTLGFSLYNDTTGASSLAVRQMRTIMGPYDASVYQLT